MKTKELLLDNIDLEQSPHVRAELSQEAVERYAGLYKDEEPLPDPVLFQIGQTPYFLADGLHRVIAAKKAGLKKLHFIVREGGYDACLKYALTANVKHGVARNNADKRTGAMLAIATFKDQSNANIAEIAACSDEFIRQLKKEMSANGTVLLPTETVGQDGRKRGSTRTNSQRLGVDATENINETPLSSQNGTPNQVAPMLTNAESKPKIITDETGYPIPEEILPTWKRRQEVQDLLTMISKVRATIEKASKEDDRLYMAELKCSVLLTDIARVYTQIDRAKPAMVCTSCQGRNIQRCTACHGRGFISRFYYDTLVDVKLKKVREAAIKGKK